MLNDIFRHLTDEDEEFVSEEVALAETIAPTEEPAVDNTPVEESAEDPQTNEFPLGQEDAATLVAYSSCQNRDFETQEVKSPRSLPISTPTITPAKVTTPVPKKKGIAAPLKESPKT